MYSIFFILEVTSAPKPKPPPPPPRPNNNTNLSGPSQSQKEDHNSAMDASSSLASNSANSKYSKYFSMLKVIHPEFTCAIYFRVINLNKLDIGWDPFECRSCQNGV